MDSGFDKRADRNLPGSGLRNEAANYLEAIHGNARVEVIVHGKKVDIVCRMHQFGKDTDLYVEVKDYSKSLERKHVSLIYADYRPLLQNSTSSALLIVSRYGLSPSAQAFVDTTNDLYHQTIWELEDSSLGLLPYVREQAQIFAEDGLSDYYISEAAAAVIEADGPTLELPSAEYSYETMSDERIPYFRVRELMGGLTSEFFHRFILKRGNFDTISIVSQLKRRRTRALRL